MKLDVSSFAHTKWKCKYHIVFVPNYRRISRRTRMSRSEYIDPFTGKPIKEGK